MSPTEIVSLLGVLVTVIVSLVVPWFLRRRAARMQSSNVEVVSWQSITSVLQKERDVLRMQVDQMQGEQRKAIKELDEDYTRQLTQARARIADLEVEVTSLRRRLMAYEGGVSLQRPPGARPRHRHPSVEDTGINNPVVPPDNSA